MSSMLRRTTLADERRALRAQSQQQTAPSRFHEETYDSSSDEEDPEPFHQQQQGQENNDNGATTSIEDLRHGTATENGKQQPQDKADLEKLYEEKLKKTLRPRRPRQTLTASILVDPETGLGRLLHNQPKLVSKSKNKYSTSACAAYTRKLFGHYHAAVREWTAGHAQPNDTSWMPAVEKLCSQKMVRDHVESLRQVICRHFVEDRVGLETADGWWQELAKDEITVPRAREEMEGEEEEAASQPRPMAPAHVSPDQAKRGVPPNGTSHNHDQEEEDDDELEFDDSSPAASKRALPDHQYDANNNNSTSQEEPPRKRRVVQDDDDESESEELEFASPQQKDPTNNTDNDAKRMPKRRVLDDDDDNSEQELELEDGADEEMNNAFAAEPAKGIKSIDKETTGKADPKTMKDKDNEEMSVDLIVNNEKTTETIVEGTTNPFHADAIVPCKNQKTILEESAKDDGVTDQEVEENLPNISSPKRAKNAASESPSRSPYRLQVLDELTQASLSQPAGMVLGQESQPFATQPSQEEEIFDSFSPTQESLLPNDSGEMNSPENPTGETFDTLVADSPADNKAMVADTLPIDSPSEVDTVVPTDSSPPEDDTGIPSMSATQATLIPSTATEETPTQLDLSSL